MNATYRLVKFSPVPEVLDPVNVAVLFENGSVDLHYDARFQRLHCLIPDFDLNLIERALLDFERRTKEAPDTLPKDEGADLYSSQIFISRATPLYASPHDVKDILTKQYLLRWHMGTRSRQSTRDARIETEIHNLLTQKIRLSAGNLWRSPHFDQYLSPASVAAISDPSLRFSRVLYGDQGIIFFDGLNIATQNQSYLGKRADELTYAFYCVGSARREIENHEKRFVKKVGILFNKGSLNGNPKLHYRIDKLGDETDLLVDAGRESSMGDLEQLAKTALE